MFFKKKKVQEKKIDVTSEDIAPYFTAREHKDSSETARYLELNAFKVRPDFEGIVFDSSDASNPYTLNGNGVNNEILSFFVASSSFIGHQQCALLSQHWMVDIACRIKGEDSVRNWFKLSCTDNGNDLDSNVFAYISKTDRDFKLRSNLEDADKFKNVFGVRHILFLVDSNDPEYYEKPFNADSVTAGSYKGISQIDPYWITPQLSQSDLSDPTSTSFYEPTYWVVRGKKIHRSHFVILRSSDLADILKPSYNYGGIPLSQKIYERAYAAERTANEAPQLTMTKRTSIYKADLKQAVANQGLFEKSLLAFTRFRDNYGVKVIGKDEEMLQNDISLADLDSVIMSQYQLVASIAEIPATKLLQTTPKGFNSTGEFDFKSYNQNLEKIQSTSMNDILDQHYIRLLRSHVCPKFDIKPFGFDISWNSLDIPSAKEAAEINNLKANTDTLLSNIGAIDGYDSRERLIQDVDSDYNGLTVEDVNAENEEAEIDPSSSLNGAQVTALTGIIEKVSAGEMSKETAIKVLSASFPISESESESILKDA